MEYNVRTTNGEGNVSNWEALTETIALMMMMMTSAMAVTMVLIIPPIAETTEP